MYLSYSGFKKALGCLFDYWNGYIAYTDMGPQDVLGSIYGSVVGRLFEDLYALKLWREKDPEKALIDRVDATLDDVIKKEIDPEGRRKGVLIWKGPEEEGLNPKGLYANREELAADIRDTVPRGLRLIRHHRLLGPRADAEFKLDFKTPDGHVLGGRADFIIQRVKPHNDLVIVDGKGSRHRGKYVDPTQLVWYAMLFWLRSLREGSPRMPDKLAFLFWRAETPKGSLPVSDDLEKGIDWVEASESDVQDLYREVMGMIAKIQTLEKKVHKKASPSAALSVFPPKASSNCNLCQYRQICPAGQEYLNRSGRK